MNENNPVSILGFKVERPLVVYALTILAGITSGVAIIVGIHQSPNFSASGYLYYLIWGMVPLSGLIWGALCKYFRSVYFHITSLALAGVALTWWVLETNSLKAIGDLIQNPPNIYSTFVWFFLLCGLMSIIDLLIGKPRMPEVLALALILWSIYVSLPLARSANYAGSKIGVWVNGILFEILFAMIWVAIIEMILLIYWEVRKKEYGTNK